MHGQRSSARQEHQMEVDQGEPCPFVYAKGKKCTGHIWRIEAFKVDISWSRADEDSLSGCGFVRLRPVGGVVMDLIVLLALASVGMVAYVIVTQRRDAAAAAERRPQPALERDLAEVGQAIAATSVLSARTERPPAESWVGASQEPWRKLLLWSARTG